MKMTVQSLFQVLVYCAFFLANVQAFFSSPTKDQAIIYTEVQIENSDPSDVIASSPLLSLHRQLVEIESVVNNEHDVGAFLVRYLEAHKFSVLPQRVSQSDPSKPSRYNILALLPGADPETAKVQTIVTSHIDTVPPFIPYNVSAPAHSPFIRQNIKISGRGSVDAKACVATQIHAVLELLEDEAIDPADVGLLFVVGEEGPGDGMKTFSKSVMNVKAEYKTVIFGEPTELKLASGHKGILIGTLKAKGKAAHSGYPWLGKSANSMIIPVLAILDRLGNIPEESGGLPSSEKYGNTTVNLGLLQGGVAANVVAEEASLTFACRLAGGTAEQARKIVTNALNDLEGDFELSMSQGYSPVDIDADVPGFETITVNYGTDIPNLDMRQGVKKYLYGPGSILVAHSDHEALTVGDLEEAIRGYKRLILHSLR